MDIYSLIEYVIYQLRQREYNINKPKSVEGVIVFFQTLLFK